MIKVSLDEAYVFDMLAILDVKNASFSEEKLCSVINSYSEMSQEIIEQIGEEKFFEIINSDEYHNLVEANQFVFNLVDRTKIEGGLAKQVDDANFNRYLKKQVLQSQFFKNKMKEVKDEKYTSS
jgi:hypothetical protein